MDRVDAMRVFARVLEQRSFKAAANELGLPTSTVTQAVKQMEQRLGVRLLQRTTRHVAPTLDGEAFYQRCLLILGEVEDAETMFGSAGPKGIVKVRIQGHLARHIVLPGLRRFFATYPNIELQISEGDRYVDVNRDGFDCVVRAGEPHDPNVITCPLVSLPEVTAASPGYLARFGKPARWDQLEGHQMIGFHSSAIGGIIPLEFLVEGTLRTFMLPMALSVNQADSYRAAARLDLGLIQVPRYTMEKDFARGTMVPLLEDTPPSPTRVSLLYPRSRLMSARVMAFVDWITKEFDSYASQLKCEADAH